MIIIVCQLILGTHASHLESVAISREDSFETPVSCTLVVGIALVLQLLMNGTPNHFCITNTIVKNSLYIAAIHPHRTFNNVHQVPVLHKIQYNTPSNFSRSDSIHATPIIPHVYISVDDQ